MVYLCPSIILILFVIFVPIKIKAKLFIDFESERGGVLVRVFGIKVFRLEGGLAKNEHGLIVFNRTSKKKYKYNADKKGAKGVMEAIKGLDVALIGNLNIRRISLNLKYGAEYAARTVYVLAAIRAIFYSATSILKLKQPIHLHEQTQPDFENKSFELRMYGIFSLSIGDIIYGFCIWQIKRIRRLFKRKRVIRLRRKISE